MAGAFVGERGFAQNKTSEASTNVPITSSVTAGNKLVLFIARDAQSISGITDTKGNTYAQAGIDANNAGNVRTSIWYSDLGTALVGGTDSITVTWGANETAKAIRTVEYSGLATGAPTAVEDQTGAANFGFGGLALASGGIAVAALGWEGISSDYGIDVANWTERSLVATSGGGATSNISVQAADTTASGTPNFAGTMTTARDWAEVAAAWDQSAGGSVNVTPSPVTVPMVVPTPTIAVGVIVTPSPVTIPMVVPDPVVSVGGTVNVTPSPVTIPMVVPTPTVSAGAPVNVTPSPVTIPLAVPVPTVAVGVVVAPSPVAVPLVIPTPTVNVTGGTVNVTPSPVQVQLAIPAPAGVSADLPVVILDPPLPAVGKAFIQIRVPVDEGWAEWDDAASDWDVSIWEEMQWVDRTPQSMNAQTSWGASNPNGFLAMAESGRFTVDTYDPGRLLDPANPSAPFSEWLRPGTQIRLRFISGAINKNVKIGVIDTIDFSQITRLGRISATDGISDLSAAIVPGKGSGESTNTLTARIEYALEKSKMDPTKPGGQLGGGSTAAVARVDAEDTSAWLVINRAALDALRYVWINRNGFILVRSMVTPFVPGSPVIGGATGIPVADIETASSMEGVLTRVIAYDEDSPESPISAFAGDTYTLYGEIKYERQRPIPDAMVWAQAIVGDRSGDAIGKLRIGTIRPRTEDELDSLLDLGMGTQITVQVDSISPPISLEVIVLGGTFEANTITGWSAKLFGYVPDWGA